VVFYFARVGLFAVRFAHTCAAVGGLVRGKPRRYYPSRCGFAAKENKYKLILNFIKKY
jgi:hypothetical protein